MTSRTTRKTTNADKPKAPAATKGTMRGKATPAPDAAAPKTGKIGSKPATTPEPAATKVPPGKKAAAKPAAAPVTRAATPSSSPSAVPVAPTPAAAPAPAAPRSPATTSASPARSEGGARAAVPAGSAPGSLDATRRHQLICEIAYGLYVARGYIGGRDLSDWLQAEAEVDRMLAKSAPERAGGTD
jgi:hypothetical protein